MKIRTGIILSGFVFALLLTGICMPVPASAETIKLTYANFPPASTFPCVQMERWTKEVEKRTNGEVKIQTFPGGTLLAAKNIFDGVITGSADIGNFAMSYQPGRFPVSEVVDLPVGFGEQETKWFLDPENSGVIHVPEGVKRVLNACGLDYLEDVIARNVQALVASGHLRW